ncbi:unnamed protein product [Protopolystoma xenopodis]|uniref:LIM zinc-binding domain-containing protein n=1 Tax=Protopolystoma xenopodis TaxID=117903 RepID=A0A448WKC8_9PLAT|nr:unnamed protein product [Protopolystoma xenopodis]
MNCVSAGQLCSPMILIELYACKGTRLHAFACSIHTHIHTSIYLRINLLYCVCFWPLADPSILSRPSVHPSACWPPRCFLPEQDLSFKERHWHEKCFKCSACSTSLADRPFATKDEQLYCSDCYDERFAARCDGCQSVFKAGMRKYEYRGQQWHEECFICVECTQPIGAKSFIPRENQVVCVGCYEAKYAQRCTQCQSVIRRGGVTYKGNPWHKECFTCSNCSKQLAGLKFTSKDERPYCADCYGELFAKKCTKCTKPITGKCFSLLIVHKRHDEHLCMGASFAFTQLFLD